MADNKPKVKEAPTPTEETLVVETPKETPKETQEVEIDTSKIEKEVTEAAKEALSESLVAKEEEIVTSAKEKIAEALIGKKEKERWVPKDYDEVKDVTKKETIKEVKEMLKSEKVEEAKKEKQSLDKWQKHWDNQITKLTDEGHLPKPSEEIQAKLNKGEALTEEEKTSDPALIARTNLYTKASELKDSNLELVFHRDVRSKTPAGATAPVLGTRKSVTSASSDEDFAYEDINPALGAPKSTTEFMQKIAKEA